MKLITIKKKFLFVISAALLVSSFVNLGCDGLDLDETGSMNPHNMDYINTDYALPRADLYSFAGGCYSIQDEEGRWLAKNDEEDGFAFVEGDLEDATPFYMKASDLATYLLYDPEGGFVVAEDGPLTRETELQANEIPLVEEEVVEDPRMERPLVRPDLVYLEDFVSGAEWELEAVGDPTQKKYRFIHTKSGDYLGLGGLTSDSGNAAILSFQETTDCSNFPELTLDAEGTVRSRKWDDDGAVFGIVEPHTHMLSNHGFGGGGVYHGATYHRFGVTHALGDCSATHGFGGARDLFGAVYENKLSTDFIFKQMIGDLITGNIDGLLHDTDGYPNFTDWPSTTDSTHQTQYYMWIKRAWKGGLRLIVQHMVSNSVICELSTGLGLQRPIGSKCNDMIDVDRQIEDMYAMERYIDAQSGGPGEGFFRIVTSPDEARDVINSGKLAVVLGIETSNLFNCFSVPRQGYPLCDEAYVTRTLDEYYNRGIRAIFPVHKFDNGFSAGDGQRDFIEVGNVINSGHLSNFTQNCPDVPAVFDKLGPIAFGGLNQPRDDYLAIPPYDMGEISDRLIPKLLPLVPKLLAGGAEGNYCQKAGLTAMGEFLMRQMMERGMIIEVDHFNKPAYKRAFEILEEYDYPGSGTHGSKGKDNKIYKLGGISTSGIGGCRNPNRKGATLDGLRNNIAAKIANVAYPGEAMSWDLNGFAGKPGPRFGPLSKCQNQSDRVRYPFPSYDGGVTFTQPRLGNRVVDFNNEGLVHIGLLPEYIEDIRRDAESDADLEPLFRSAEAYLRMWEKSERRGEDIANYPDDDWCPSNPNKIVPGQCGCDVADLDWDFDGTMDCIDQCRQNPDKIQPGFCGCDTLDWDTDIDGVADCIDSCPRDRDKVTVGICGCNIPDTDSDGDGTADCNDLCPDNPDKLESGVCGCAEADEDSDGDGAQNCVDECPADSGKVDAGVCGCGVADADSDGDGMEDCIDQCAADPAKTQAGICGCGVADTDSDGDGTADCNDQCAHDPNKILTGLCGCGRADTDSDGDGTPNCYDQCPNNPAKTRPGECGCGTYRDHCKSGVIGDYYDNKDLTGHAMTRVDQTINFDWGLSEPPGVGNWSFGVRWQGYVEPPTTGEYTFYTQSDDGVRLWVDGRLIIDDWRPHGAEEHSGRIRLEARKQYSIKLEYFDKWFNAMCKLFWSGPNVGKQIIPSGHLFH